MQRSKFDPPGARVILRDREWNFLGTHDCLASQNGKTFPTLPLYICKADGGIFARVGDTVTYIRL